MFERHIGCYPPREYDDEQWMKAFWVAIIRKERGEISDSADALPFADLPALGRFPITKPSLLDLFGPRGKTNESSLGLQVRPFNFMLVAFPDTGNIATGGEAYVRGLCQHDQIFSTGCPHPDMPCRYRRTCPLVMPIRAVAPTVKGLEKLRQLRWVNLHSGKPVSLD